MTRRKNSSNREAASLLLRLDRMAIWPYPRRLLLIIGIGFFFAFFDIITIGIALPKLQSLFSISLETASWTVTSSLIGYILGSFVIARISDRFGRRLALYLSIAFFSIGSICTAVSFHFDGIVFWRLITGIGIGAEISEVSTYMSEMAPAKSRGRYTTIAIAWGMLGFALVPFVAWALVPNFTWGWRAMFVIGAVGGFITLFMRRHLPDSPRWLLAHHQVAAAEAIISAAEQRLSKKIKLPEVKEAEVIVLAEPNYGLLAIFKAPYGARILLFMALWFVYYIGNYAWLTLAPSLIYQEGVSLAQSLGFVSIASIGFVLGSLLAVVFGDRYERKWLISVAGVIWILSLLSVGFCPSKFVLISAGFLAASTIGFMIPLMYTYTAEHFPTQSRATSVAVTDGVGHLGGAFCGQIVLGLAAEFSNHFAASFSIMALSGLLALGLVLIGKRMNCRSLNF